MEAHPAAVLVQRNREGVHLLVSQPGPGQVQLLGDIGHVDDVVGGGVEVEAEPGDGLLGARPSSRTVQLFEHDHVPASLREVAGCHQAVVARPDDDVGAQQSLLQSPVGDAWGTGSAWEGGRLSVTASQRPPHDHQEGAEGEKTQVPRQRVSCVVPHVVDRQDVVVDDPFDEVE